MQYIFTLYIHVAQEVTKSCRTSYGDRRDILRRPRDYLPMIVRCILRRGIPVRASADVRPAIVRASAGRRLMSWHFFGWHRRYIGRRPEDRRPDILRCPHDANIFLEIYTDAFPMSRRRGMGRTPGHRPAAGTNCDRSIRCLKRFLDPHRQIIP